MNPEENKENAPTADEIKVNDFSFMEIGLLEDLSTEFCVINDQPTPLCAQQIPLTKANRQPM